MRAHQRCAQFQFRGLDTSYLAAAGMVAGAVLALSFLATCFTVLCLTAGAVFVALLAVAGLVAAGAVVPVCANTGKLRALSRTAAMMDVVFMMFSLKGSRFNIVAQVQR